MEYMYILAALAVLAGGAVKGVTGAGAPVIAIPALTMLFDVKMAVTIMVVPNLLSNVWQAWAYRRDMLPARFMAHFAGAGVAGVIVGSVMLSALPPDVLSLIVASVVAGYVALRVARPGLWIPPWLAQRLAALAGLTGGALQGATGLSAPISITFLNAQRLARPQFIGTISVFFITMTTAQIVSLVSLGLMDVPRVAMGLVALGLIFAGMPLGTWLGRRISTVVFDRIILALLAALAVKIFTEAALG